MNKITIFVSFFALFLFVVEAKAISISPPVIEAETAPGNSIERTIEINNETDQERVYEIGVKKFEMTGEEGRQKFFPVERDGDSDLAGWIRYGGNKITIPAKSAGKLKFAIDVPFDADPGGHYASIYFNTGKAGIGESDNSTVGVEAQINSLILLKVSGNVKEEAEIESFDLKNGKTLLSGLPAEFVLRIKNSGNVHIKPKGNIEIKNIFGKKSALLDANPQKNRVLPGSIRKIESQWGDNPTGGIESAVNNFIEEIKYDFKNFALGRYSARLDIVYGAGNGKVLSREISFWVIPWKAIMVSLAALIIALLVLSALVRRYNRWIISKYSQSR